MRLRSLSTGPLVLSLALAFTGPSLAFVPSDEHAALEFPLEFEASPVIYESEVLDPSRTLRSPSVRPGWTVQRNPRTGILHMAYGSGVKLASPVTGEAPAADAARDFLLANSDVLGTEPGNMDLRNVKHARGKYAVHYNQMVEGVPVWRSTAWVLMGEAGDVMAYGSDFFPRRQNTIAPATLSDSDAIQIAIDALGTTARSDRPVTAEMFMVPAASGELMALTRAWRVVFESNEPLGKWASFVDARTGAILSRENHYRFVNVTGNVDTDVQDFGLCDGNGIQDLRDLTVNVSGGNSDVTDENGDYDISHGGASPVTVTASLLGPFADMNNSAGGEASFSGSATPGTPFPILWNNSNSSQDERTTFFHINRSHAFIKGIHPSFTELDYAMPTDVGNTSGLCPGNAWWDGVGTNYCLSGGAYNNTGELGNVAYHEYGHGVTQEVYTSNGASEPPGNLHEGNSDVLANLIDRQPIIGLGFFTGNCTGGIRNSDNTLVYPDNVIGESGHFGGQVIAGFHWDAWQSMLVTMSQSAADEAARDAWHFGRDMGTPQSQPDQVLWTFMADDDDADLTNGSPHFDHFCIAAQNHGFSCPTVTTGVFVTHTELPTTTDGSLGFEVDAIITSTEAAIDLSSLLVHFRVNGGAFTSVAMAATGNPDEYRGHLPAMSQSSEVDYYITAADLNTNAQESPINAPASFHTFEVVFIHEDLESGLGGWTAGIGSDDATTGQWGLFDPVGTAAQPEDDSSPSPGTDCFITGQCASGHGTCTNSCGSNELGCNDVDGGTTTLLSPVYDLNGAVTASIKYDRWFSNDTGSNPSSDAWIVDVSNNGGSSWTNVENTTTSSAKWNTITVDVNAIFGAPDQVQLRFRAADLGGGSVVEAGVDELRVLADFGGVVGVEQPLGSRPATLSLRQNQPNPFRPSTRIEYGVPSKSEIDLTVYNVNGQAVRTLASGPRAAGDYKVNWDGRDSGGQRVAAGVYFYRLSAAGKSITKKMTVMQ